MKNFLKKHLKSSKSKEDKRTDVANQKESVDNSLAHNEIENDEILDESLFERIYPLLRSGDQQLTEIQIDSGGILQIPESARPIMYPVSGTGLSILIGEDHHDLYTWLKNKDTGNKELKEVVNIAFRNLFTKYPEIGIGQLEYLGKGEIGQVGTIVNGGDLGASLIIVETIWEGIYSFLGSKTVNFIVPEPETLMFCDAKNRKGNTFLLGHAEKVIVSHPKPLTNKIFQKTKASPIIELVGDDLELDFS